MRMRRILCPLTAWELHLNMSILKEGLGKMHTYTSGEPLCRFYLWGKKIPAPSVLRMEIKGNQNVLLCTSLFQQLVGTQLSLTFQTWLQVSIATLVLHPLTFSLHFIKHRHAICKGSWILSYLWSLWGQRIFVFAIICRNSCSAYAWHCTSTGLSMKASVTPPTPLPASSFGLCKGRRGSRNFWLTWGEL